MEKLDTLKLSGSTLVIFTSDDGYNIGHNGIWHKGNGYWLTNSAHEDTVNVLGSQRPNMYEKQYESASDPEVPRIIKAGSLNASLCLIWTGFSHWSKLQEEM